MRASGRGGRGTATRATEREVSVVAAVVAAGSEKEAAHRLGLSHSTLRHHLANARSKVGATTTAQLVWILAERLSGPGNLAWPDESPPPRRRDATASTHVGDPAAQGCSFRRGGAALYLGGPVRVLRLVTRLVVFGVCLRKRGIEGLLRALSFRVGLLPLGGAANKAVAAGLRGAPRVEPTLRVLQCDVLPSPVLRDCVEGSRCACRPMAS
jgi:DNA-binding CsgD family transcriptional regulator